MSSMIKADALRLVENLPDGASWEDLMYEIYVHQAIEAGLEDCRECRKIPTEEVRKQFGLSE
jgi:hypothetical protein